jgi:trehalose 6-phosphate phosphatase
MKYVRSIWPLICKRICSARRKLLILDFDGTLAEIANMPHEVVLDKNTEKILTAIERLPSYLLAVISGRRLDDLRSFLHMRNAIYVGNHGFELKGLKFSLPRQARIAEKIEIKMRLLCKELKENLCDIPGVWIEDKSCTISLHYRNVPKDESALFGRKVRHLRKIHSHLPICWREGKKVWDIRPKVKWDKGEAALYLARKFVGALPIVIGDDVTDEDMFKRLKRRAITIRVGYSRQSAAEYYLKSPRDVRTFLEDLIKQERVHVR